MLFCIECCNVLCTFTIISFCILYFIFYSFLFLSFQFDSKKNRLFGEALFVLIQKSQPVMTGEIGTRFLLNENSIWARADRYCNKQKSLPAKVGEPKLPTINQNTRARADEYYKQKSLPMKIGEPNHQPSIKVLGLERTSIYKPNQKYR